MNVKKILVTAASAVLAGALTMASAGAYFSDYEMAEGTRPYDYSLSTTLTETIPGNYKSVTLTNNNDSVAANFRVKILVSAGYDYSDIIGGIDTSDGWYEADDGYIYYGKADSLTAVQPGESTNELIITVNLPEAKRAGQEINVIVVYEAKTADAEWPAQSVEVPAAETETESEAE